MLISVLLMLGVVFGSNPLVDNNRPPPSDRLFVSQVIEDTLNNIVPKMKDPEVALLFVNCFPNTLDTTVYYNGVEKNPDTFVITGDINAMWLRDSSGQVLSYVQFAQRDPKLKAMLKGVIARQVHYINVDSYANAFNKNASGSPWDKDIRLPKMGPLLWEGKYEIDSLAWVMRLSVDYFKETKDESICTPEWMTAMEKIAVTLVYQQQSLQTMDMNDPYFYFFQRNTNTQSETLQDGIGVPSNVCGLSRAGFRPSDDAHRLPFQIAGNSFAQVTLSGIVSILQTPGQCFNQTLSSILNDLSNDIKSGINKEGIVSANDRKMFAYEVDGFGSRLLMDDANVPSLLSLPFLGYLESNDPVYLATREILLSNQNPYFFCGQYGCGIGSPHTGLNRIWPMSLIMQAMTSNDDSEIEACLNVLKTTTAGKNFMHESFSKDNPDDFTRSWFAWANSMFGGLIIKLAKERPHIIFSQ